MLFGNELSLLHHCVGNAHTDYRETEYGLHSAFVVKSRLTFAPIIMAGVSGFADRSGAAYITAQLLFE